MMRIKYLTIALLLAPGCLQVRSGPSLEVSLRDATSLGTDAFSANGRIQPHGEPTQYYFEYGLTSTYGAQTPTKSLGPQLAAYYNESWDDGLGGWRGGTGIDLAYVSEGGTSGGYCSFAEPNGTDYNHTDGVGLIHLAQYFYPGVFDLDAPTAALGGGRPDLRDARVNVWVRGTGWETVLFGPDPTQPVPFFRGDELVWWSQTDASEARDFSKMSNWAHTGFFMTGALFSGDWTQLEYTLHNDTNDWTYAGQDRSQGRDVYVYEPINEVLREMDVDFFHLLLFIDDLYELRGIIDFDEMEILYRNYSLLRESNGGALSEAPIGSTDPAALTDGRRHGEGHMWQSAPNPQEPLSIIYDFATPITLEKIQLHNNPDFPSQDVEILSSLDGISWTTIASGTLPEVAPLSPNFNYLLVKDLNVSARHIQVRILSGYRAEAWGLGEIEVFGSGAVMRTDDDWYGVSEDITGLTPGQTYHYRLVAIQGDRVVYGDDAVFTVPTGAVPEVTTGQATLAAPSQIRLAGRINTLGTEGNYFFELGTSTAYGLSTAPVRTGPEITPRTFSRLIDLNHPDLAAFTSGTTLHYRIVLDREDGVFVGEDTTFVIP
jgi:hypothetical protein